jgi:hypothetical protein
VNDLDYALDCDLEPEDGACRAKRALREVLDVLERRVGFGFAPMHCLTEWPEPHPTWDPRAVWLHRKWREWQEAAR